MHFGTSKSLSIIHGQTASRQYSGSIYHKMMEITSVLPSFHFTLILFSKSYPSLMTFLIHSTGNLILNTMYFFVHVLALQTTLLFGTPDLNSFRSPSLASQSLQLPTVYSAPGSIWLTQSLLNSLWNKVLNFKIFYMQVLLKPIPFDISGVNRMHSAAVHDFNFFNRIWGIADEYVYVRRRGAVCVEGSENIKIPSASREDDCL